MIQNTDIYQTIRTAWDTHLNSLGEIERKKFVDADNYYDTWEWLANYLMKTLTEEDRVAIISRFGMTKFLQELPIIAKNNCWESYNDFIDEYGADDAYTAVLRHIVIKEVLPELE